MKYEVIEEMNGPYGLYEVGYIGEIDTIALEKAPSKFVQIGEDPEPIEVLELVDDQIVEDLLTSKDHQYPEDDTVNNILNWVGTDNVRAQEAYDIELDRDKPRKGITVVLEVEQNVTRSESD